jgi:hypothetical protein
MISPAANHLCMIVDWYGQSRLPEHVIASTLSGTGKQSDVEDSYFNADELTRSAKFIYSRRGQKHIRNETFVLFIIGLVQRFVT